MYKGTINKYRFELDDELNRIVVYKEGSGVDPIRYINVSPNISEKSFHYEIMDFVAKQGKEH